MYNDLADVLESDFTDGNRVLSEVKDLYTSCVEAIMMTDEEVAIILVPAIRQLYQNLGKYNFIVAIFS